MNTRSGTRVCRALPQPALDGAGLDRTGLTQSASSVPNCGQRIFSPIVRFVRPPVVICADALILSFGAQLCGGAEPHKVDGAVVGERALTIARDQRRVNPGVPQPGLAERTIDARPTGR